MPARQSLLGGESTSFLPTDVTTATLLGWGDEASMNLDGGNNLTSWDAAGGSVIGTLTSNGGSDPATAVDVAINSQRAVTFDGSDNYVESSAFIAVTIPYHIFIVIQQVSWTSSDVLAYLHSSVSGTRPQIVQQTTTPNLCQVGSANCVSATLGTWYLLESLWKSGGYLQRLSDASAVTGGTPNPTPTSMDQFTLGAFPDGQRDGNVKIAGYAVYDGEVTGTDYSNIRTNYFNRVFGLW